MADHSSNTSWLRTWLGRLVNRAERVAPVRDAVDAFIADRVLGLTQSRPLPFSCWTPGTPWRPDPPSDAPAEPYVSWTGLFDRGYTGRHLPPQPVVPTLPPLGVLRGDLSAEPGTLLSLFERRRFEPCPRSSALLCFFAQWFTDSFMRTDPTDLRRNRSNHEIDLNQIYGPDAATTDMLRAHGGGRLRTRQLQGGYYPDRLMTGPRRVRARYAESGYAAGILGLFDRAFLPAGGINARRAALFATGLEQGNSTIFYAAISTIFIREHNRIADVLQQRHPDWDDDRLFETARNTLIALLLKVVIEEYVAHLSGLPFRLHLNRHFAEHRDWYRTNRIAIEFDLLYRWHSLVPDAIGFGDTTLGPNDIRYNPALLERLGAPDLLGAASAQHAGRIGLRNTPRFLMPVEARTQHLARVHRLQPYNAYRACFGLKPMSSFRELTDDLRLASQLDALYGGRFEDLELSVGLLAEKRAPDAVFGELMGVMVAVDAFSQIYTNPLLSTHVYGTLAFDEYGLEVIETTTSLEQLVHRNTPGFAGRISFAKAWSRRGLPRSFPSHRVGV
jgi:prostaglandin-endoperoxide synthase 2